MSSQPEASKSENLFFLSRLKKQCYYEPVYVDFNPVKRMNNVEKRVVPEFNKDQKYYTSAFISEYDQLRTSHNSESTEKEFFERKIRENLSKPEMQSPAFNAEGISYCSICSAHFPCYWKHVSNPSHLKRIQKAKGNHFIHQLCQQFTKSKEIEEREKGVKTKKIKKQKKRKNSKQETTGQDLIIIWPPEVISYLSDSKRTYHPTPTIQNMQKH